MAAKRKGAVHMKKSEPAVKEDNAEKAVAVIAPKTVLETEKKPEAGSKTDKPGKSASNLEAVKAEKSAAPKAEAKAEPAKPEKSAAPKAEAKAEPAKPEKATPKAEAKAEKAAPKPKARLKAGPPVPDPAAEHETAKPEAAAPAVQNPPAVAEKAQVVDSPLKRMKQEFTERTNVIKKEMRNIQNSFLIIGFQLHWIKTNNMYRVMDYKNIMDYAEKEFGIKKSTCCNFINIIENYAERDENGEVIESIADCYRNFSSSQLVAMLGMPEEMQQQVTPDMSVRAINRLRKGEPETPAVDAPRAVISEAKPAAPVAVQETAKPAAPSPVPVPSAARPVAPVPVPMTRHAAVIRPAENTAPPKTAVQPAIPGGNTGREKPMPKTLAEFVSYSGYRGMMEKIDSLIKGVFAEAKGATVKIIYEQG